MKQVRMNIHTYIAKLREIMGKMDLRMDLFVSVVRMALQVRLQRRSECVPSRAGVHRGNRTRGRQKALAFFIPASFPFSHSQEISDVYPRLLNDSF